MGRVGVSRAADCFVWLPVGASNRCSVLGWLNRGSAEGRHGSYTAWVPLLFGNVRAEVCGSSVTIVCQYLLILIVVPPVYGGLRISGVGVEDSVAR